MKESSLETTNIEIRFKGLFYFFQTAWCHMATWTHMVRKKWHNEPKRRGKNNLLMNIALKIIGPYMTPCIYYYYYFNYKRMHFHFFMVCEIPGMILVFNFHKYFLFLVLRKLQYVWEWSFTIKCDPIFSQADLCSFICYCVSQIGDRFPRNSRNTKAFITSQRFLLKWLLWMWSP